MEQRIGRIDRVRSKTERELVDLERDPEGRELLQVYYPYLEDTVEILQVQRVLKRMNAFLRLMHEDLVMPKGEQRRIDVEKDLVAGELVSQSISERLYSAFPVPKGALQGRKIKLLTTEVLVAETSARFADLHGAPFEGVNIEWEPKEGPGALLGTVRLTSGRVQPFSLLLRSLGEHFVVRCISPVGLVALEGLMKYIAKSVAAKPSRLGAIQSKEERSYTLTVENDVVLGKREHDLARVGMLLRRVADEADRLEQVHLPGRDQRMVVFEKDLKQEGNHGQR
jgi:hypothetical protein